MNLRVRDFEIPVMYGPESPYDLTVVINPGLK